MTVQAVRIQFITDYQRRGIQAYQRDLAQIGNSSQAAATKVGTSMGRIASASRFAGTALMVGVGAALAVGIKASVDFEDAFAGVRKTVDASEPEFQRLAEAIIALSTEIPVSAKELAKIGELGGQLGIPIDNMDEFIEVIAKLGVATNLSLEDAATSLARFANVMGSSEDDFDNIASSLVELGNNAAAQEDEILRFATRLAGIGATVGATEGDILGLAAAFTELGVAPERGATAVQRAFVSMLEAVQGGGEELAIFAEVAGITREEFTELFNLNPVEAFLMFEEGLARINHEGGQTTTILQDVGLGSQRTLSTMLKGANGFDILREQVERGNDAFAENNALNEEAEKRFETIISQLGLMKNAALAWTMSLGGGLLPTLKDIIQVLTAFFEVLSENEEVTNAFILAIVALGVGRAFKAILKFGGAMDVLSITKMPKFVGAMDAADTRARTFGDTMRFAWTRMGGFSGVVTLAGIALGGLALAMAINKKRAKENQKAIENLADQIENFEDGVGDATTIYEAFVEALRTPNALFDLTVDLERVDLREALVSQGVTAEMLVDLAINDPEEFERRAAEVIAGLEQDLTEAGEGLTAGGMFGTPEDVDEARHRLELVKFTIKEIREETGLLRQEEDLRQRERRAGFSGELEDWHRLEIARSQGLVTPGGFDIPEFIPGFRGTLDEYEDVLADMREETQDFGQDFVDDWFDIVDDLGDALLDYDSALDDFEVTTEFSLNAISESMRNWVTEQSQITEAMRLIVERFGVEAGQFFLTLDPGKQGEIAAAVAAGSVEAALDTVEDLLESRESLMQLLFEQALMLAPLTAGKITDQWEAFVRDELVPILAEAGEEGIDPGTEAFNEAISEMFPEAFATIAEQSPVMGAAIQDMLEAAAGEALIGLDMSELGQVEEVMRGNLTTADKIQAFVDMGFEWGEATALGFMSLPDMIKDINALIAKETGPTETDFFNMGTRWAHKAAQGFEILPNLMEGIGRDAAGRTERAVNRKLLVKSPSKVFEDIGKNVAMGFDLGLQSGGNLSVFKPHQPMVNIQTPPSSVSRDLNITIDHPEHRGDDILSSLQESTTLVALTRFAETTPGNN